MNSNPNSETINLFSDNKDDNIINNFEVIRVKKRKKTVSFSHSVDIVNVENQKQLTRRISTPHNIIEENSNQEITSQMVNNEGNDNNNEENNELKEFI